MFRINDQTLLTNAFGRGGVVEIVAPYRFVVSPEEIQGLVIYIMRVGSEYMKGGHAGKKSSSFVARMKSEFGCLVPGDSEKRRRPFAWSGFPPNRGYTCRRAGRRDRLKHVARPPQVSRKPLLGPTPRRFVRQR